MKTIQINNYCKPINASIVIVTSLPDWKYISCASDLSTFVIATILAMFSSSSGVGSNDLCSWSWLMSVIIWSKT